MNQEIKKTPKEYVYVGYDLGLKIAEKCHSLVFGGENNEMMESIALGVFDNGGEIIAIAPHWIGDFDSKFDNCSELIMTDSMDEKKIIFRGTSLID